MALDATFIKNELAAEFGQRAAYGTVFTSPTGATPGSEPTGGDPAFARKPLVWSAPVDGVITASATFDIPEGTYVTGSGLFDALTGGNFVAGKSNATEEFPSQDKLTVNYTYSQV